MRKRLLSPEAKRAPLSTDVTSVPPLAILYSDKDCVLLAKYPFDMYHPVDSFDIPPLMHPPS